MEDNISLRLDNVSVMYRRQDSRSTADIIKGLFKKDRKQNGFWALRNISFSLEKGDMLGVIGRNGAGKSTLMKTISGTLTPASGTVEKEGNLCALLELGTGFDREMTVKENVYLRGALLGYSKEFIDSRYDEIIDYADMREFENNPFRTLSSGMKSRIAFSIASIVRPDIIILDEIFAVGDGDFREKSRKTMEEIVGSGETTALVVSHSLAAVRKQCNKVLWLNKGRMVMFGDPDTVCDAYSKFLKTGIVPETESIKAVEEHPKNNFKRSKKKVFGEVLVYLLLLLLAAGGVFFWSQYDLFRANRIADSVSTAEILGSMEDCRDRTAELLGTDTSGWDADAFETLASELADGDITLREAAKTALGSTDNKYELYLAELELVRNMYSAELDETVVKMRDEYEQLPADGRPSLWRFAYSHMSQLLALEKRCDADVQSVVEEIRTLQRSSGLPEKTADLVQSAYNDEKIFAIAYYIDMLRGQ